MIPSEREVRVRYLERRVARKRRELEQLDDKARALKQAVQSVRQFGTGGPPPCNGLATFHAVGCDALPIEGATVTAIKGLVTLGPGTTDAAGDVTLAVPEAGVYAVTLAHDDFPTMTVNRTLPCFAQAFDLDYRVDLPAGWRCCPRCPMPLPETLYLTDNNSSIELHYDAAAHAWLGGYCFSTSGGRYDATAGLCLSDAVSQLISYALRCSGLNNPLNTWELAQSGTYCADGVNPTPPPGPGQGCDAGSDLSGFWYQVIGTVQPPQAPGPGETSCRPLSLTFNFTGGPGGTVMITE